MNPACLGYMGLTSGLFLFALPYVLLYTKLTNRYRSSISQRIGLYPPLNLPLTHSPRIWLHAVSMGEVNAAVPIIEALQALAPHCTVILSTTTEHGQALAKTRLPADVICIYAPIDFILSVKSALRQIKPDLLVCLETELWPNWLMTAHRMGIKTAIVNGRISERAIKRYMKIRPLMKELLGSMNVFSMIQEIDARRIREIGAAPEKIRVNGNAKYDLLLRQSDSRRPEQIHYWRRIFGIKGNEPVFLAGSMRHSEEEIILDAYQKVIRNAPNTLLILAPRHLERTRHIEKIIKARGLDCQLRTCLENNGNSRKASVIILDTMGELQATYSIATVVFCGGSLTPLGGQNILEPAVWAKPVLYGPHMEDFVDARSLLESTGGGIEVKDGNDLAEKVLFFITRPDQAKKTGDSARRAVEMNQGAAQKHAEVIYSLLHS
ncbi:MAG: 3-deoxy-D-manno-octulosonic acid transferase [Deltaproteobacteria bacterium]|nr:3-deoxy-D-manno-octulosonic acid transferase [Deltaproteobacteria bacterium]